MSSRRTQLRAWLLAMAIFEIKLRGKVARARNAFIKQAATGYADYQSVPGWAGERHRRALNTILVNHYNAVIPRFGSMALAQVKSWRFSKKAFNAKMQEWVTTEALRKATMIAATDYDDVRGAIQDGITEGLGTAEIARDIRKVSELTSFRAATVARTETHNAATFGAVETAREASEELGIVLVKEWLATKDNRTRPEHRDADGQQVGLDERFTVGGESMDRPGDPAASPDMTINCRCAVSFEEKQ